MKKQLSLLKPYLSSVNSYGGILHLFPAALLCVTLNTMSAEMNSANSATPPSIIPQSIIESGGTPTGEGAIYILPSAWEDGHLLPAARVEVEKMTSSEYCHNCPNSDADSRH